MVIKLNLFYLGLVCLVLGALIGRCSAAEAKTLKIAIIDTGYDAEYAVTKLKLCPTGHFNFATNTPTVGEALHHGTDIGSIIAETLKDVDYCAIIYQVMVDGEMQDRSMMGAIDRAAKENLTAVNVSIVSSTHSYRERMLYKKLINSGAIIFAAAGNENHDLTSTCNYYPGCYKMPGVVVVGAMSPDLTQKATYSNYGKDVNTWYPGHFKSRKGWVHGTSFATPYALGDFVRSLPKP